MVKNSNKLKIAIVTNNYTPYCGGVVSSINSFVSELKKQNHEVFIITLDFLGDKHKDPDHIIRIPSALRFMLNKNHMAIPIMMTHQLETIIKKIKPDIIHTQHPFFIGKSALKVAKRLHIPIVFTYHTIYERYLHYLPLPKFITEPTVKKLVLSFCKNVDGIIVPSSYIKKYLQENNIKNNITTIPSGIFPHFIKEKSKKIENSPPGKNFKLLTVSRFVKEKNLPFLLNVFKKICNKTLKNNNKAFTFTLAGYGPEYENIKHYAYNTLCINPEYLKFIHNPNKNEIEKLYSQSDLFLFSSTSDTQGLVLAEAMGCGCPVVALDGPGQRDIVKNNINGFLVKSDEQQMIKKIFLIQTNQKLYNKLRTGAFETGDKYHPKEMTALLSAFYNKIIDSNKSY